MLFYHKLFPFDFISYVHNSRVALFCFFNVPDFPVFRYLFNILSLFPVIFDDSSNSFFLISFICFFSSIKYEMLLCVLHFPQRLLHHISRCFFCEELHFIDTPYFLEFHLNVNGGFLFSRHTLTPIMLHPVEFVSFVANKFRTKFPIGFYIFRLSNFLFVLQRYSKKRLRALFHGTRGNMIIK